MAVRVNKAAFNLREKFSELERPIGLNGAALMATNTPQEAFSLIGAGRKNRIINGNMIIDQRYSGTNMIPITAARYSLDRWAVIEDSDGAATVSRSTVAPPGFTNSLLWTTTTADTSLAAAQYAQIFQNVEGFNIADLNWGTSNAKPVTLSFWVRSSLTGNFSGALRNASANRSYPFLYSISSANTWEYKTITIPGETSGTWQSGSLNGVTLTFSLGTGANFVGAAESWYSANVIAASGETSILGTLNATWYITGVQLEEGRVATPFEYRNVADELALCQRYYYRVKQDGVGSNRLSISGLAYTSTLAIAVTPFPVEMRTAPTALEQSGTAGHYSIFNSAGNAITCTAVPTFSAAGKWYAETTFTVGSVLTAGNSTYAFSADAAAYLGWSAEL